jgi:hypothetical protein
VRPVRAELKFHGDSGDDAEHEVDAKNPRPEARCLMVGFVVAAQSDRLEHHNQRGQTHGELRKKIMEGDRKCEVNAVN